MRRATTLILSVVIVVLTGSAFAQEGPIKYRRGVMKAMQGHADAIAQIAYGGVDHGAHLTAHADAFAALSKMVPTAFEEDAMATDDVKTRAKEQIWDEWSDFQAEADALAKATADFAAAARSGAKDVAAKLDPVWDSCKGCHKKFRAKRK